ncbi:adherens junction-associated protein 1 [Protopterus annectens]|uniref:adherens junction-associated protein 1 n=1 Tax=Protopterus annectens TaxID=7888 RepID=UPI001CFA1AD6|nr:adherens junction-associated protein 1 [Protopterus annectens]
MWIKQLLGLSLKPVCGPAGHAGSRVWILLAMFHLAMEIISCEPVFQARGYRLLSRPSLRHRASHFPSWNVQNGQQVIVSSHWWNRFEKHHGRGDMYRYQPHRHHKHRGLLAILLCKGCQIMHSSTKSLDPSNSFGKRNLAHLRFLKRSKRQTEKNDWDSYQYKELFLRGDSPSTTVSEYIEWGPTGDDDTSTFTWDYDATRTTRAPRFITSTTMARTTTALITTITSTTTRPVTAKSEEFTPTPKSATAGITPGRSSTTEPYGYTARPPKPMGVTTGLAVHQIITITVSLVMVIAALITTLVLKNCCAQSGNGHRNSHQRKINQQEESCQNLTDFTAARVPSNMDIFTAYNESLQCSHECVSASVPVYTDETLHPPAMYKTAYNGSSPYYPVPSPSAKTRQRPYVYYQHPNIQHIHGRIPLVNL